MEKINESNESKHIFPLQYNIIKLICLLKYKYNTKLNNYDKIKKTIIIDIIKYYLNITYINNWKQINSRIISRYGYEPLILKIHEIYAEIILREHFYISDQCNIKINEIDKSNCILSEIKNEREIKTINNINIKVEEYFKYIEEIDDELESFNINNKLIDEIYINSNKYEGFSFWICKIQNRKCEILNFIKNVDILKNENIIDYIFEFMISFEENLWKNINYFDNTDLNNFINENIFKNIEICENKIIVKLDIRFIDLCCESYGKLDIHVYNIFLCMLNKVLILKGSDIKIKSFNDNLIFNNCKKALNVYDYVTNMTDNIQYKYNCYLKLIDLNLPNSINYIIKDLKKEITCIHFSTYANQYKLLIEKILIYLSGHKSNLIKNKIFILLNCLYDNHTWQYSAPFNPIIKSVHDEFKLHIILPFNIYKYYNNGKNIFILLHAPNFSRESNNVIFSRHEIKWIETNEHKKENIEKNIKEKTEINNIHGIVNFDKFTRCGFYDWKLIGYNETLLKYESIYISKKTLYNITENCSYNKFDENLIDFFSFTDDNEEDINYLINKRDLNINILKDIKLEYFFNYSKYLLKKIEYISGKIGEDNLLYSKKDDRLIFDENIENKNNTVDNLKECKNTLVNEEERNNILENNENNINEINLNKKLLFNKSQSVDILFENYFETIDEKIFNEKENVNKRLQYYLNNIDDLNKYFFNDKIIINMNKKKFEYIDKNENSKENELYINNNKDFIEKKQDDESMLNEKKIFEKNKIHLYPYQGRFIVHNKNIKYEYMHEIIINEEDVSFNKENDLLKKTNNEYKLDKYELIASKLKAYKENGINILILRGCLKSYADDSLLHQKNNNNNNKIKEESSDSSPYCVSYMKDINELHGNKNSFEKLINEAKKINIKIITDLYARISTKNIYRKYENLLLYTIENKEKKLIKGTFGLNNNFYDSTFLNFRNSDTWNVLLDTAYEWLINKDINGIKIDNGEYYPLYLNINEKELNKKDYDNEYKYTLEEKLLGKIVLPKVNIKNQFYNLECSTYYPNPLYIKINKELWKYKDLVNLVDFYDCSQNSSKYLRTLCISGIIPQIQSFSQILSELKGKYFDNNNFIKFLKEKNIDNFIQWFYQYFNKNNFSFISINTSNPISLTPILLYDKSTWPFVDLLFTLPFIPCTSGDEIFGKCFNIYNLNYFSINFYNNIGNIYEQNYIIEKYFKNNYKKIKMLQKLFSIENPFNLYFNKLFVIYNTKIKPNFIFVNTSSTIGKFFEEYAEIKNIHEKKNKSEIEINLKNIYNKKENENENENENKKNNEHDKKNDNIINPEEYIKNNNSNKNKKSNIIEKITTIINNIHSKNNLSTSINLNNKDKNQENEIKNVINLSNLKRENIELENNTELNKSISSSALSNYCTSEDINNISELSVDFTNNYIDEYNETSNGKTDFIFDINDDIVNNYITDDDIRLLYNENIEIIKNLKNNIQCNEKYIKNLKKLENIENKKHIENEIYKNLGPDFGFDLKKIKHHYKHRRMIRKYFNIFTNGDLIFLKPRTFEDNIIKNLICYTRIDIENLVFSLVIINYNSSNCNLLLSMFSIFQILKKKIFEECYKNWNINDTNKDDINKYNILFDNDINKNNINDILNNEKNENIQESINNFFIKLNKLLYKNINKNDKNINENFNIFMNLDNFCFLESCNLHKLKTDGTSIERNKYYSCSYFFSNDLLIRMRGYTSKCIQYKIIITYNNNINENRNIKYNVNVLLDSYSFLVKIIYQIKKEHNMNHIKLFKKILDNNLFYQFFLNSIKSSDIYMFADFLGLFYFFSNYKKINEKENKHYITFNDFCVNLDVFFHDFSININLVSKLLTILNYNKNGYIEESKNKNEKNHESILEKKIPFFNINEKWNDFLLEIKEKLINIHLLTANQINEIKIRKMKNIKLNLNDETEIIYNYLSSQLSSHLSHEIIETTENNEKNILIKQNCLNEIKNIFNKFGIIQLSNDFIDNMLMSTIVFVTTEYGKWSTVGGLGVMIHELATTCANLLNQEIWIITPYYNVNRYNETNYLKKDNIKYMCNIEVNLVNEKITLGVHAGIVDNVHLYFVHNEKYFPHLYPNFNKYDSLIFLILMAKGSLQLICHLSEIPQLIVTNDWPTGLLAAYAKQGHFGFTFNNTKFFHIIHNLDINYEGRIYQDTSEDYSWLHSLPSDLLIDPHWDRNVINPSRCALMQSDNWGTVSKSYRDDLRGLNGSSFSSPLSPLLNKFPFPFAYGNGVSIQERTNKIKSSGFNNHHEAKEYLQKKYFHFLEYDSNIPLISFVGRIVQQKGISLIVESAEQIIKKYHEKIQFMVCGNANYDDPYSSYWSQKLIDLNTKYPHSFWADPSLFFTETHIVNLGSDFGLMPSIFEPGGIVQHEFFVASTPVIAFKTGGLKDTVFEFYEMKGNGFTFESYNSRDLCCAIDRAVNIFYDKEKYQILRQNAYQSTIDCADVAKAWIAEFSRLCDKIPINMTESKKIANQIHNWDFKKWCTFFFKKLYFY